MIFNESLMQTQYMIEKLAEGDKDMDGHMNVT
jgi:hypothetical protein